MSPTPARPAHRRLPSGLRRARLRLEELEPRCQPSVSGVPGVGAAAQLLPPSDTVWAQQVPNDPLYESSLWNMKKIGAPAAWDLATGRASVVVADTDSGIDFTHPDLYLNVWINQGEIPQANAANIRTLLGLAASDPITFWELNSPTLKPYWGAETISDVNLDARIDARDVLAGAGLGGWANGANEDAAVEQAELGRGFVDDLVGWDFWNGDNNPYDDNGHGTHTAGTIGAVGNNGEGVAGVSWVVQIMPVKIIGPTNSDGTFTVAAQGVRYAAAKGARVSNNSWGGTRGSTELRDALVYAQGKGQVFVAAAMNNGINNDASAMRAYPASYEFEHIIAVAATDINDVRPKWSNYGKTTVDLGAPGVNVWSTVPVGTGANGGNYAAGSGTSMAAPHVAGAAALLLARNPSLGYRDIKSLILSNVDKVKSLSNVTVSGGRLNVGRALSAAPAPVTTSVTLGTAGAPPAGPSGSFSAGAVDAAGAWTFVVTSEMGREEGGPSLADRTTFVAPALAAPEKRDAGFVRDVASPGASESREYPPAGVVPTDRLVNLDWFLSLPELWSQ